jgi:hypothetical protein
MSRLTKRSFTIPLLFFTFFVVCGNDACREDYEFAARASLPGTGNNDDDTATPTATAASTSSNATPTATSSPTATVTPTAVVTLSPTITVIATVTTTSIVESASSRGAFSKQAFLEIQKEQEQEKKADVRNQQLIDQQHKDSQYPQSEDINWLGNAFQNNKAAANDTRVPVDADNDGYTDQYEMILGTDPDNASSFPNFEPKTSINRRLSLIPSDGNKSSALLRGMPSSSDSIHTHEVDSDRDGINDDLEVSLYGSDSFSVDTDEDGITDRQEITVGSDPILKDTEMPDLYKN